MKFKIVCNSPEHQEDDARDIWIDIETAYVMRVLSVRSYIYELIHNNICTLGCDPKYLTLEVVE